MPAYLGSRNQKSTDKEKSSENKTDCTPSKKVETLNLCQQPTFFHFPRLHHRTNMRYAQPFVALLALMTPTVSGLLIPGHLTEDLSATRPSLLLSSLQQSVLSLFKQDVSSKETQPSYKSMKEDWPIDLTQYEDFQIIRIAEIDTNEANKETARLLLTKFDKWEANPKFIDFKVPRSEVERLDREEIKYSVIVEDLAQAVFDTYPKKKRTQKSDNDNDNGFDIADVEDFLDAEGNLEIDRILELQASDNSTIETLKDLFFKDFRPLNTIYSWLDLVQLSYPELVNIEWLGTTFEGRDMKAIHLSSPLGLNPKKKIIVVTSGVHSREWISVSTSLFMISKLLENYRAENFHKKETFFLNHLDFLFIPVFNPDGYEYSWNSDRLWRKNRQETYLPRCFGIDIDHSFGYHWSRSEDYPCGESYSGEVEFEAIEAANINHYINVTKNEHDIYGYIDLHSYTQKILYPYAYSCHDEPRDAENLIELAYGLQKEIRLTKGKHYEVAPACQDRGVDLLPGLGAGSSLDYMYHIRARWAFQLKLRDTGSHGFLLPSTYIKPVGTEIYSSIKYFCDFILNPEL
jgi:extracellular matrix protein 14